jgi:hypothetical protein
MLTQTTVDYFTNIGNISRSSLHMFYGTEWNSCHTKSTTYTFEHVNYEIIMY